MNKVSSHTKLNLTGVQDRTKLLHICLTYSFHKCLHGHFSGNQTRKLNHTQHRNESATQICGDLLGKLNFQPLRSSHHAFMIYFGWCEEETEAVNAGLSTTGTLSTVQHYIAWPVHCGSHIYIHGHELRLHVYEKIIYDMVHLRYYFNYIL